MKITVFVYIQNDLFCGFLLFFGISISFHQYIYIVFFIGHYSTNGTLRETTNLYSSSDLFCFVLFLWVFFNRTCLIQGFFFSISRQFLRSVVFCPIQTLICELLNWYCNLMKVNKCVGVLYISLIRGNVVDLVKFVSWEILFWRS